MEQVRDRRQGQGKKHKKTKLEPVESHYEPKRNFTPIYFFIAGLFTVAVSGVIHINDPPISALLLAIGSGFILFNGMILMTNIIMKD